MIRLGQGPVAQMLQLKGHGADARGGGDRGQLAAQLLELGQKGGGELAIAGQSRLGGGPALQLAPLRQGTVAAAGGGLKAAQAMGQEAQVMALQAWQQGAVEQVQLLGFKHGWRRAVPWRTVAPGDPLG